MPQTLGSLFVSTHASQGYGGSIRPRLHVGYILLVPSEPIFLPLPVLRELPLRGQYPIHCCPYSYWFANSAPSVLPPFISFPILSALPSRYKIMTHASSHGNRRYTRFFWNCNVCRTRPSAPLNSFQCAHRFAHCTWLSISLTYMTA
jgi:hypothetical protein